MAKYNLMTQQNESKNIPTLYEWAGGISAASPGRTRLNVISPIVCVELKNETEFRRTAASSRNDLTNFFLVILIQ